jgi:hypothetical protein
MKPSFRIRFIAKGSPYFCVMAEVPPHERTLFAYGKGHRVSLPWMVFVVVLRSSSSGGFTFCGLHTYFRDSSLESATDKLTVAPFANTGSSAFVCLGDFYDYFCETVEDAVAGVMSRYYLSEFSSDRGFFERDEGQPTTCAGPIGRDGDEA